VERLSPANAIVARGSRVAFHPLTGQAVVAIPYVVGRTLAVGSAVSPRAAASAVSPRAAPSAVAPRAVPSAVSRRAAP
jgi:hypothetical protein